MDEDVEEDVEGWREALLNQGARPMPETKSEGCSRKVPRIDIYGRIMLNSPPRSEYLHVLNEA